MFLDPRPPCAAARKTDQWLASADNFHQRQHLEGDRALRHRPVLRPLRSDRATPQAAGQLAPGAVTEPTYHHSSIRARIGRTLSAQTLGTGWSDQRTTLPHHQLIGLFVIAARYGVLTSALWLNILISIRLPVLPVMFKDDRPDVRLTPASRFKLQRDFDWRGVVALSTADPGRAWRAVHRPPPWMAEYTAEPGASRELPARWASG